MTLCQVRFIPSWFPGAGFKRDAQSAGKEMARLEAVPFERATEQIVCRTVVLILTPKQTPNSCLTVDRRLCPVICIKTHHRR